MTLADVLYNSKEIVDIFVISLVLMVKIKDELKSSHSSCESDCSLRQGFECTEIFD